MADALQFKHKSKYGAYEDGRAEPPMEILLMLSDYFEVPMDLLVKEDLTNLTWQSYWNLKDNWVKYMPLREVKRRNRIIVAPDANHARAGVPAGQFDDEVGDIISITLPHDPGDGAVAFPVAGDSMPPLDDGDFVIGKRVGPAAIKNGRTYIIRFQEDEGAPFESVYKIVFNNLKADNTFLLHSTNPGYQPKKLEASKVREIYEYCCHISYKEPSEPQLSMDDIGAMIQNMNSKLNHIKGN